MQLWCLADLHLSFGIAGKEMSIFGENWENHPSKIKEAWQACIAPEDIVLLAGDISWATKLSQALVDLEWIDQLPGTKLLIRGNHDYWWDSLSKMQKAAPPSLHFLQNNAIDIGPFSFTGTRLFDTSEYRFDDYIIFRDNPKAKVKTQSAEDIEKIFNRELERLELGLKSLNPHCRYRIAMTHYPPIDAQLTGSRAASLFSKYQVDHVVFGHLHSLKPHSLPFGKYEKTHYHLTSADYLDFKPLKLEL